MAMPMPSVGRAGAGAGHAIEFKRTALANYGGACAGAAAGAGRVLAGCRKRSPSAAVSTIRYHDDDDDDDADADADAAAPLADAPRLLLSLLHLHTPTPTPTNAGARPISLGQNKPRLALPVSVISLHVHASSRISRLADAVPPTPHRPSSQTDKRSPQRLVSYLLPGAQPLACLSCPPADHLQLPSAPLDISGTHPPCATTAKPVAALTLVTTQPALCPACLSFFSYSGLVFWPASAHLPMQCCSALLGAARALQRRYPRPDCYQRPSENHGRSLDDAMARRCSLFLT